MSDYRPTRDDLLHCLREALTTMAAAGNSASRFELRVAARTVDLIRRELDLGAAARAAEHTALRALLGDDASLASLRRELCTRLADGRAGHDDDALLDTLRGVVALQLAIDNPDFLSPGQRPRP